MKNARLLIVLMLYCLAVKAQQEFEFTANCRSAQEAILQLKFSSAKTLLLKERKANPNNLIPFYLDNYIDFLSIIISEEKSRFELVKANKDIRLELIEKGNKKSPYYLLTLAEINLQWAFARIKFNEYLTAALEVNRAYKMLELNQQKFPDFVLTKKCLGLLHAAVGTIPDEYKWAVKLFGFSGSIKQGEEEVKEVMEATLHQPEFAGFNSETQLLLSVIDLNLADNNKYVENSLIPSLAKQKDLNVVQLFCYANSCFKLGKTDEGIVALEKYNISKDSYPFYYLYYLLGQAKLNRLDADANVPLEKYLKGFKGINFVKAANLRLSWHYLLSGDLQKYRLYQRKIKEQGTALVDEDKQAKRESEQNQTPTIALLKARLLFDGGYYSRAQIELKKADTRKIKAVKDKLEIVYRLARIYHKQNSLDLAIANYELTLQNGSSYPYYYAANSALQLGLIYESQRNVGKAKEYYNRCLSLKDHEYQNSISQKAKAGINRLENN